MAQPKKPLVIKNLKTNIIDLSPDTKATHTIDYGKVENLNLTYLDPKTAKQYFVTQVHN